MGKRTRAVTVQEYYEMIALMEEGRYSKGSDCNFRANEQIRLAIILETNLGMRIIDILSLKLNSFFRKDDRYMLNYFIEKKTKKPRAFTVKDEIVDMIRDYCTKKGINDDEFIFTVKEREVQKYIKKVADYMELDNISTHSFRKLFGTQLYINNGYDVVLVQTMLQHSSPSVTLRYIDMSDRRIEDAISKHLLI